MQRRAKAIAKAADELGGKKQKQSSFEDESLVKALYVGSSMPSDMKGALSKLKEVTGKIISKADTTIVSSDSLVEALGDTSGNKLSNIKLSATEYKVSAEADKAYGASEGMVWGLSDELPGGVVYAERSPIESVSGVVALTLFGKVKRGIRPAPNTKVPSTTKVTTLNAGQIEAVAKIVEEIGSDVQTFRTKTAKLDELMNKAVKAAEKAGATAEKEATTDAEKAEQSNAKALQSAAGNIGNYLIGGFSTVTSNAIRTGQAALNYCDKSINQYE
jgi:outer membrane murein-binding lipoprotein Lpp